MQSFFSGWFTSEVCVEMCNRYHYQVLNDKLKVFLTYIESVSCGKDNIIVTWYVAVIKSINKLFA